MSDQLLRYIGGGPTRAGHSSSEPFHGSVYPVIGATSSGEIALELSDGSAVIVAPGDTKPVGDAYYISKIRDLEDQLESAKQKLKQRGQTIQELQRCLEADDE